MVKVRELVTCSEIRGFGARDKAVGVGWGWKLRLLALISPQKSYVVMPGRVAKSVGHLIRKSEVLGSIPGLATSFHFSFG